MTLNNFHTHTVYGDGKNTAESTVNAALNLGMQALGFSEHSPLPYAQDWALSPESEQKYVEEITLLKEKYADKITIYTGIEQDILSGKPKYAYDYVLGSVHHIVKDKIYGVDEGKDAFGLLLNGCFGGDYLELAREYFALVTELPIATGCSVIAHFDLITKYNENYCFFDETDNTYLLYACSALETLIKKYGMITEVNTGAMARALRTSPYPSATLLNVVKDLSGKILISSDCHDNTKLCYAFDEAYALVKNLGFCDDDIVNGRFPLR